MPYIEAGVSVALSRDQKLMLKEKLGQHICVFEGKSEKGLMISLEDEKEMYHGGQRHSGTACFKVFLYGPQLQERYLEFTKLVCETCEKILQINSEHVYIIYVSAAAWGCHYCNS